MYEKFNYRLLAKNVMWMKFGWKFHLIMLLAFTPFFFFFEIPTCGEHVVFVTEFVIFGQNLQFYEVKFIYSEKATKFYSQK